MGQCLNGMSAPGRPRRAVGRERRFRRLARQYRDFEACAVAKNSVALRRLSKSTTWAAGNLRRGALVAPAHRHFADDYEVSHVSLGAGMSGDVFLAQARSSPSSSSSSGCPVAVKTLERAGLKSKHVQQEVDIYLDMDHSHIAQLLQVYDEEDKVYLVMEHCSGGSLMSRFIKQGGFTEQEAADALRQLLKAIRYCHGRPGGAVIHRDIKPQNLVYASTTKDAPLKLVDFGLSCVLQPGGALPKDSVGTLDFMAPEVLARRGHTEACDMWSAGVIAYLLLSAEFPFNGEDAEKKRAIQQCRPDFGSAAWLHVSEQARDFVGCLLRADPTSRMTSEEALRHPWLAEPIEELVPSVGCTPWALPVLCKEVLQQLLVFAGMGAARRACCALAVYSRVLSPEGQPVDEDVRKAEDMFRALDKDGNGAIELTEFGRALHESLGVGPEESRSIFERLDLTGQNRIERSQFLAAVVGSRLLGRRGAVQEAFERFDSDGSGSISPKEMTELLGPNFCGEDVTSIFGEMDMNSDKEIDFNEFVVAVTGM